jgi:hypothetical protein
MDQHLQAIATVLSLVNPFVCGAMFARIEAGRDLKQQLGCATMSEHRHLSCCYGTKVLYRFCAAAGSFLKYSGAVEVTIGRPAL